MYKLQRISLSVKTKSCMLSSLRSCLFRELRYHVFFFPLLNYRVGSSNNFQKYIKKNYENYMIFEKEFLLILTSILLI